MVFTANKVAITKQNAKSNERGIPIFIPSGISNNIAYINVPVKIAKSDMGIARIAT